MRLEQLQYLIEVADTGSITAASAKLFVAQPSVSQAIHSLEKELNLTIFSRSRSGSEPTPGGRLVIEHARKIMDEIHAIEYLSEWSDEDLTASITLGGIPALCTLVLPQVISEFKQNFPNVCINIQEAGSSSILTNLKNGTIDIGLISMKGEENPGSLRDGLVFLPIIESELKAYVGRSSPLAKAEMVSYADLIQYPLLLYTDEFELYHIIMDGLRKYGEPSILASTRNPESMKHFLLKTDSVGFGPEISWREDPYVLHGDIIPLRIQEAATSTFGIAYYKGKKHPKVTRILIDQLESTMKELSSQDAG